MVLVLTTKMAQQTWSSSVFTFYAVSNYNIKALKKLKIRNANLGASRT